ncbi:N-terminal Xaa-Pro-Lys N-methyltransferase 1-like [Octopus sinensis]|uniref:Alpha N-terminal protein methyltransferase 1 n=1 Tax=Octopus sinensis TaxID=2607531 RepID=A0A7E6EME5_9MOLL|nr:N-terminal Xaa-Pro-Lys N-methyltransferase 1-like [Octopus sinensis]
MTPDFISNSRLYIGEQDYRRVIRTFCTNLRDFSPEENCYDIVWVQWVSGHLLRRDFVRFLRRIKRGLRVECGTVSGSGVVIVKDNTAGLDYTDDCFLEEDNSAIRSFNTFCDIFQEAGLTLLNYEFEKAFPKELFDVVTFALTC